MEATYQYRIFIPPERKFRGSEIELAHQHLRTTIGYDNPRLPQANGVSFGTDLLSYPQAYERVRTAEAAECESVSPSHGRVHVRLGIPGFPTS